MLLGGLQKTTLIDYPGKIVCTVFTVGCNFRCPFCHNRDLVGKELFKKSGTQPIKEKEFFEFLRKRKKILDGVCVSGGEPTIWPDLPEFIRKIKALGYLVKLDTNGSNPEMLEKLIKEKLIDYVAMDVKSDFGSYQNLTKVKSPAKGAGRRQSKVKSSIRLILKSGLDYEFRTTVVPELHTKESLIKLAKQLKDLISNFQFPISNFNWHLQSFRPKNCLDPQFLKIKPYSEEQMREILAAAKKILPNTKLRGVDS